MTERDIMLRNAILIVLAPALAHAQDADEAFVHAQVQATLGVSFTAAEITAAFQRAEQMKFVTGLPNTDERTEWRITSEGRHHLIA